MNDNTATQSENINIVVVGHVDHGKSTVIGRLLADTGSVPQGKIERIREKCRRNSKLFEYAFLLDALKDEQEQGITIDSARCFFKTGKRRYTIIDAPGHVEFIKNMVTGASRAEAALLVIDASEGIQENSKRHAFLLSMLGIKQLCILINKMDLIGYRKDVYDEIVNQYMVFLNRINLTPQLFIPLSAIEGENIAGISGKIGWYKGPTVLEALDMFTTEALSEQRPLRMPVQGVYKFTKGGDTRRIIAGSIESGRICVNDEVIFYPSGKKSKVKSLEGFNSENKLSATAGFAIGFTLEDQIYVKRGEIATLSKEPVPKVSTIFRANVFWLGREAMQSKRRYSLKIGTAKVGVTLQKIEKVMDTSELEYVAKDRIEKYDVAECILKTDRAIAFDTIKEFVQTARLILVDNYEISGGGIILEALDDRQVKIRQKVIARNGKWERSLITTEERTERYNQKSALILITGNKKTERKALAKALEKKLFHEGKWVFYLGIGKNESLRRFAEVAHLILQAGVILIATTDQVSQNDLDIIKTIVDIDNIEVVWVGDSMATHTSCDLQIREITGMKEAVGEIKKLLQRKSIIFKPI